MDIFPCSSAKTEMNPVFKLLYVSNMACLFEKTKMKPEPRSAISYILQTPVLQSADVKNKQPSFCRLQTFVPPLLLQRVADMVRTPQIHITSLVVAPIALYSASVDERETIVCFLDFHEMSESLKKIQKPVTELRVSLHPAQSESLNARNFDETRDDKKKTSSRILL
ncbi:hypothetical protein LXL04_001540 [Taraxacum kok-saghyz]